MISFPKSRNYPAMKFYCRAYDIATKWRRESAPYVAAILALSEDSWGLSKEPADQEQTEGEIAVRDCSRFRLPDPRRPSGRSMR